MRGEFLRVESGRIDIGDGSEDAIEGTIGGDGGQVVRGVCCGPQGKNALAADRRESSSAFSCAIKTTMLSNTPHRDRYTISGQERIT
jgi:hypothetical protein